MSKRLLSAILVIAMVASLCTSLFTVGASAATNYEADREALKEAIYDLYVKGPEIDEDARRYLVDTGILTVACDKCDITDGEKERYLVFGLGAGRTLIDCEKKCDEIVGKYVADATVFGEYDTDAIEAVILEAASAYYFGQQADTLIVDDSFNAGRNDIVKDCLKKVKAVIADLEDNVKAKAEGITKYAEVYKAWVEQYHTGTAYNPNFGVNPYGEYADVLDKNDYWNNVLQGYKASFPRWFSFAEMRADANVAPKLVAFERAYREAQAYLATGVLFYDFMTGAQKTGLEKAWKDLCDALLAQYKWDEFTYISAAAEVTAYNTMNKVVAFYDKYIADAYLNIYTSANQALLSNIAMAKLVAKHAGTNVQLIYAIGAEYYNKLTSDIVAGLAALDPAAASLALTAEDIDSAVKAINEAQALLNAYANWAGLKDDDNAKWTAWTSLNDAVKALKVMIPYDAVSPCVYKIAAAEDNAVVVDFDKKTELKANNEVVITFMPNYFAFVKLVADFETELADMLVAIDNYNNAIDKLDKVTVSTDNNKNALKAFLLDYDFLVGKKLDYDKDNDEIVDKFTCKDYDSVYPFYNYDFNKLCLYWTELFYEKIVSEKRSDWKDIDDDQAYTQATEFIAVFGEAIDEFNTNLVATTSFKDEDYANLKNEWDWKSDKISGAKNGYDKIAEALKGYLPYLTANLEQMINYYGFIASVIADHFKVAAFASKDYTYAEAFVGYGAKEGKANAGEFYEMAMAAMKLIRLCKVDAGFNFGVYVKDVEDAKVNAKSLAAAYNTFLKEVNDLLTEKGQGLVEDFIARVDEWIKANDAFNAKKDYQLYELFTKNLGNALKLPTDVEEAYLYYNLTLDCISNDLGEDGNMYFKGSRLYSTIYKVLADKSQALKDYTDIVKFDREYQADFAEVRELAGHVLGLFTADAAAKTATISGTDMPLYYVLNVIEMLDVVIDTQDEHTLDAIEAYKAEVLYPVLAASELNMYDFTTDVESFKDVWAAYETAYAAAIAAKYDLRMPKADIDTVAANLSAAVALLADFAKAEASATKADLEALIVAAEALLARADDVDTAAKLEAVNALKAAISAAKQFLVGYNYNINYNNSNNIDAAVAALQAAIDAVDEALYFADDLTAYLTIIAANNAGYEAMNTAESYAALVLAWSNAAEVAQNANLNASAYIAAADAVKAAVEALEAKPAPVEPEEPAMTKTFEAAVAKLAELKAVSTEGFTAESVSAFNEAVARLEIAIKTVAADDVLLEFIANAYIAKAQLATIVVENPTTCD